MTARRILIAPALAGAALCLPLLALPARADVLTAQQILSQFNLVDLGNLSSSGEVEGRTFVGGNLSGNSSTYGTRTLPASSYATLTVDGAVSASVNVNTGGIAVGNGISGGANINGNTASQVGGTITGQANFNGGSVTLANAPTGNVNFNGASHTVVPGTAPGVAASTFSAPITTLSSQLNAMSANSTIGLAGNTATFTATPVNGVAVFDILDGSSFFSTYTQFQFNLNGASSVIIDVGGSGTVTDSANFLGGSATAIAADTIWNFAATSTLNVDAEFGGTILAENASVSSNSSIDGTLVANSFNEGGEMHQYNYGGALPASVPVPEPASMAMLVTGVLGLVALRRRRSV